MIQTTFTKKEAHLVDSIQAMMLSQLNFQTSPDWPDYVKILRTKKVSRVAINASAQKIEYFKRLPKKIADWQMTINIKKLSEKELVVSGAPDGETIYSSTLAPKNNPNPSSNFLC